MHTDTARGPDWVVDRRIPLAFLAALVIQVVAIVTWAVRLDSRVGALESRLEGYQTMIVKVVRLEERFDNRMDALSGKLSLIQDMLGGGRGN